MSTRVLKPTEPTFFKPIFEPESDSYYEAIEAWLTRNQKLAWRDRAGARCTKLTETY